MPTPKHAEPLHVYPPGSDGQIPIVTNIGGCPDAIIAIVGYDCPERRIAEFARLFAAAPDLLKACKLCLKVVDDCYDATGHFHVGQGSNQRRRIIDALAKAEGEHDE